MVQNFDACGESDGHESGAVVAFVNELRAGPFAPALAKQGILDRHGVTMRLNEFLQRYLNDQVVAIFDQACSPVGRPALALRAEVRNPAYWRGGDGFIGYRLSSLFAGAWEGVRNLDMSVLDLDAGHTTPQRVEARPTGDMAMSDFLRVFAVGARFSGQIERRAHGAQGWIVLCAVEGRAYHCFLPDAEIDQQVASPGLTGEFAVISTLPQKRSVLLRFLAAKIAQQTTELGSREDPILLRLKERLFRLKQLHTDGELSDEEFATRRQRIIDEI